MSPRTFLSSFLPETSPLPTPVSVVSCHFCFFPFHSSIAFPSFREKLESSQSTSFSCGHCLPSGGVACGSLAASPAPEWWPEELGGRVFRAPSGSGSLPGSRPAHRPGPHVDLRCRQHGCPTSWDQAAWMSYFLGPGSSLQTRGPPTSRPSTPSTVPATLPREVSLACSLQMSCFMLSL